jgi:hypothetical protein
MDNYLGFQVNCLKKLLALREYFFKKFVVAKDSEVRRIRSFDSPALMGSPDASLNRHWRAPGAPRLTAMEDHIPWTGPNSFATTEYRDPRVHVLRASSSTRRSAKARMKSRCCRVA